MLSIEWLMSVVVVGVAVHLLAAYVKPRLDRLGSWASRSWAARSERRQQSRMARIALLKASERARFDTAVHELRCRIRATHFILSSFVFVGFAGTTIAIAPVVIPTVTLARIVFGVFGVLAVLTLLLALDDHVEAMQTQSEMREAAEPDENR